ncbi:prepilin-type N-terminal cleavage/methylation domain-containing protein [Gluconacetobacter tumulisoli]|uniref:Prepilin-type N-terminal cleavage/methylation domain-containing protein n=1 Tax=Gluconacetobacter tumulisoli TaxID=1286189 RepID=A0A7W4K725_9PROT|nr:prepilin-type N-terminal cleavage/methylation domain-containing protein [Gluconacetobacter tumulisoli]MBB2201450.1 prepilin-type N-terminal cleavage/methylation domain-containing protein [Gluconacetobacter tumulisoli]
MRSERGFTLLETIVALAIAGAALAVLMLVLGGTIDGSVRAGQREEALEQARSRLEMALTVPRLPTGQWEGQAADAFRWRIEMRLIGTLPPSEGRHVGFYAMDVTVLRGPVVLAHLAGRRFAPAVP